MERDGTTFWTVGHSTRTQDELIELLRAHAIGLLVDVRRFPGSRRHPQFGQQALAAALERAGIQYRHEPDLGGRRPVLPDSPNAAWRNRGFRGYADHMGTAAFLEALDRVIEAGRVVPTAVMCAEAVPWRCHRNLIADALVARGHAVAHILAPDRADAHSLSRHARLRSDGVLVYPGGEQLGLID